MKRIHVGHGAPICRWSTPAAEVCRAGIIWLNASHSASTPCSALEEQSTDVVRTSSGEVCINPSRKVETCRHMEKCKLSRNCETKCTHMEVAGSQRDKTDHLVSVCMFGTGEYTTGFVGDKASDSDKSTGVVALVMLDLRRRGLVGRLGMCGTNGKKLPAIRAHMKKVLGDVYAGIEPECIETWPADDVVDPGAFQQAANAFGPGDVAIIFTPDDTHPAIAAACLERGMHVMITKPVCSSLKPYLGSGSFHT